ncbi:2-amino-4-hydroxy-6-hydroxymethyldihydropteridine diphosphokinase [Kordiimonas sp. SCSIO 12610]|uniref:2-amino-4-hydroxy-6- hydroxymethyldihydropteridine diphosphokinase n=1 Tax=Kordiimonas sp. SCSIO 12610 TaxID=2829597 RepID=UPI00210E96FF|nr:2-amino-4-hydroxy-6-hydroxymethyldihydropteridine diphosphokinase [Kordiimonas sp. SCSIO 12610]UTW56664.1 2-amino-4-hydroxy-6-hydroxymethyldihydropteridine diphosphokinase [Kordiimonas sp. SCSIO 12610]
MTTIAALGANIPSRAGQPIDTLRKAITLIDEAGLKVLAVSKFYVTKPVPVSDQPDFINCAVSIECDLTAKQILSIFHRIEAELGRERGERWSARTLDIDLIAHKGLILPDQKSWSELANHKDASVFITDPMVPHPRAHKRMFVMDPIVDVAPDWVHPVFQKTATTILRELEKGSDEKPVVIANS